MRYFLTKCAFNHTALRSHDYVDSYSLGISESVWSINCKLKYVIVHAVVHIYQLYTCFRGIHL